MQRVWQAAGPKAACREAYISDKGPDWITVEGITLQSTVLGRNVEQVEKAMNLCGTHLEAASRGYFAPCSHSDAATPQTALTASTKTGVRAPSSTPR